MKKNVACLINVRKKDGTDGRQTETLYFPLDAASVIIIVKSTAIVQTEQRKSSATHLQCKSKRCTLMSN